MHQLAPASLLLYALVLSYTDEHTTLAQLGGNGFTGAGTAKFLGTHDPVIIGVWSPNCIAEDTLRQTDKLM